MEDASVIKQMLTIIGFESCIMKSIIHLSTDTGTKKPFVKILTKGMCFYTMRFFKQIVMKVMCTCTQRSFIRILTKEYALACTMWSLRQIITVVTRPNQTPAQTPTKPQQDHFWVYTMGLLKKKIKSTWGLLWVQLEITVGYLRIFFQGQLLKCKTDVSFIVVQSYCL